MRHDQVANGEDTYETTTLPAWSPFSKVFREAVAILAYQHAQ